MSPTPSPALVARQFYYNDCYYGNCDSNWNQWGRWVLLVCIIVAAILLLLFFSCVNSRRRRRNGLQPRYGTGWLAGKTPEGHNAPSYTGYNNQAYNPGYSQPAGVYDNAQAPPYSPPVNQQYTGNTFHSNEGYYGQEAGIELQPPPTTYAPARGNEPVYAPPEGPPSNKNQHGDGVIR